MNIEFDHIINVSIRFEITWLTQVWNDTTVQIISNYWRYTGYLIKWHASAYKSKRISIRKEIDSVVTSLDLKYQRILIENPLNVENCMVFTAQRSDESAVDYVLSEDKSGKQEEDEKVESLALKIELKKAVDLETNEAQLAEISSVWMLYEGHFVYSNFDIDLSGLKQL